jgi:hypothetical protein
MAALRPADRFDLTMTVVDARLGTVGAVAHPLRVGPRSEVDCGRGCAVVDAVAGVRTNDVLTSAAAFVESCLL